MLRKLIVSGLLVCFTLIVICSSVSCVTTSNNANNETLPKPSGFEIIASYPHDKTAYTQGFVFESGYFYEGTGLTGNSNLRKVALETGRIIQIKDLPPDSFGEGVTVCRDRIIQLTWRSNTGFVFDKNLNLLEQFRYETEGWGITYDGKRLIMSDGTASLYFLDTVTYAVTGSITVQDQGNSVANLNELEYIDGEIYANIWQTDRIARIDPSSGEVKGWIDLSPLLETEGNSGKAGSTNGIAYEAVGKRIFVTGKLWSRVFEIRLTQGKQ